MKEDKVMSLFLLLNELHPREAKKGNTKERVRAWYLVMEPFEFEAVKDAAIRRARVNRFYPEPAELTEGLAKKENNVSVFSPQEIARCSASMDEMLALGDMMEKDYIGAGLPHPAKARGMGWTAARWIRACREAGL